MSTASERPERLGSEAELIEYMTRPSPAVTEAVQAADGDFLILGVGGKMGPSLAELMVRAGARRVIGVARFSDPETRAHLDAAGVETVQADLLADGALRALPEAPNVFLLAGFKFGATGNESLTWAMNTQLPPMVVERYRDSRIVYVSSGNVYAFSTVRGAGASEGGDLGPIGEYAQSRLGGERLAEYAARSCGARLLISRLFYATELRYGIIHDIGWRVWQGEPIDLTMGHVNQIWQGDANSYLARSLPLCEQPPAVMNLTGRQVLSVRALAEKMGRELDREPVFVGSESDTALLGDAGELFDSLGEPDTPIGEVVAWMAHWIRIGGCSLGKPTKYESRAGKF